jgi:hypothetical protein
MTWSAAAAAARKSFALGGGGLKILNFFSR